MATMTAGEDYVCDSYYQVRIADAKGDYALRLAHCGAPRDFIRWAADLDVDDAWQTCVRPDWLIWHIAVLAAKPESPERRRIVSLLLRCVEPVLRYANEQDKTHWQNAINAARSWVNESLPWTDVIAHIHDIPAVTDDADSAMSAAIVMVRPDPIVRTCSRTVALVANTAVARAWLALRHNNDPLANSLTDIIRAEYPAPPELPAVKEN
ncbi:MAG: hypothetical protein IMZ62_08015 [Chloroflexi bacterium]|nr:hypothetical protein [Chloroflexota bacterium]MBE3118791.1 hypothetical protein [Candidatus Atribacteria bacterium]